jgi:hypothetical protein
VGGRHAGDDVHPAPVADQRLDGRQGPLSGELDDGQGRRTAAEAEHLTRIPGDPGAVAKACGHRREERDRKPLRACDDSVDLWLAHVRSAPSVLSAMLPRRASPT